MTDQLLNVFLKLGLEEDKHKPTKITNFDVTLVIEMQCFSNNVKFTTMLWGASNTPN